MVVRTGAISQDACTNILDSVDDVGIPYKQSQQEKHEVVTYQAVMCVQIPREDTPNTPNTNNTPNTPNTNKAREGHDTN